MFQSECKNKSAYALVTGAASGIGREYARLLAEQGFGLILVDNREAENRLAAREITDRWHVPAWPLCADLAHPDAAERLHAETSARGWCVEVLICNAGRLMFGSFTAETTEAVAGVVALHCTTPALLCRLYGAEMQGRGRGRILLMSSATAWMPYPTIALYAATKAFLKSLARALYDEFHDRGVTVTVVFPGAVDTPFYRLGEAWRRRLLSWGVMSSPHAVAKKGLRALFRGRSRCIPGIFTRLCIFAGRLVPSAAIRVVMKIPAVRRML